MLTPFRRVMFQAFIVSLGIWTGAGVHATGLYFVPQLGLFGPDTPLSDADIVRHSKAWIRYNAVRLVVLIALFYYALSTLARMAAMRDATV